MSPPKDNSKKYGEPLNAAMYSEVKNYTAESHRHTSFVLPGHRVMQEVLRFANGPRS